MPGTQWIHLSTMTNSFTFPPAVYPIMDIFYNFGKLTHHEVFNVMISKRQTFLPCFLIGFRFTSHHSSHHLPVPRPGHAQVYAKVSNAKTLEAVSDGERNA